MALGSIQNVSRRSPVQQVAQLLEMQTALRQGGCEASQVGLATHFSTERAPLLITDPRKIAPVPVHLAIRITRRLLRVAVEAVIEEGSSLSVWLNAGALSELLCN